MENWKDIKGYEGLYKVSSYGRIMTVRKKAILCPAKTISNGLTVSLSKNGRVRQNKLADWLQMLSFPTRTINHTLTISTECVIITLLKICAGVRKRKI